MIDDRFEHECLTLSLRTLVCRRTKGITERLLLLQAAK
jgi:hypothetical protein